MSYYFKFYKALPKRRDTVDELVDLLEIEKTTRDAFDKELQEESDENKKAIWLGYWKQWQSYCSAWTTRIESISQSDFSLGLLDAHEKITIEEAFCILKGITPDALDEVGFLNWRLSEVPRFLRVYRESQIPAGDTMPTFLNIEQQLRGSKEYKKLVREFGEPSDEETLAGEFERIDTQAFIEWALKLGYIVPNEPHLYANNKPPYHPDFARMLHSLLTKHKVIDGEFESKWKWLGSENSLAYLVELLHQNGLPFQWHADNSYRTTINWTNILHYVDYQGESPLRKNAQYGKSGVKFKSELNQTIDSLLIDYEGWKHGRKDEFLELE
jgi:hypothetical protein